MSKKSNKLYPSGSSVVSKLQDKQDNDDLEIQRHHVDLDESCIETSPVITQRISAGFILTPKKLRCGEEILHTKPTDENDIIITECITPETSFGEINNVLLKCPMKVYKNKRTKSDRSWKKLSIASDSATGILHNISLRDELKMDSSTLDKNEVFISLNPTKGKDLAVDDLNPSEDLNKESEVNRSIFSSQSSLQGNSNPVTVNDENRTYTVSHQIFNPTPSNEVLLHTPKSGIIDLSFLRQANKSINVGDKMGDSMTLSDASPLLWGSSISGVSPLSQSSLCMTDHAPKESPRKGINLTEENSTNKSTNVLTSTPLSTKMNLEWEESTVTDGLSQCSSLLLVRKVSRVVNSSEIFAEFSQESIGSDYTNDDKTYACVNSSQELSGSDKENVDPNFREIRPKVKRFKVENGLDCEYLDNHTCLRSCPKSGEDHCSEEY